MAPADGGTGVCSSSLGRKVLKFLKLSLEIKDVLIVVLSPIIIAAIVFSIKDQVGLEASAAKCLFVLLLMAVYWMSQVLPLAVTALIPMWLIPLLGVASADCMASQYMADINMLFMGGLIVAAAVEHSNLHKRIALGVLQLVGSNIRLLMAGLMLPTWLLSMWISNSATSAMMVPIAQALIGELRKDEGVAGQKSELSPVDGSLPLKKISSSPPVDGGVWDGPPEITKEGDPADDDEVATCHMGSSASSDGEEGTSKDEEGLRLSRGLSLCICYAATCGGISTLTGTGPNLVLVKQAEKISSRFNETLKIDFTQWMTFALPVSAILLVIVWLWLQIVFVGFRCKRQSPEEKAAVKDRVKAMYNNLGKMSFIECMVLFHFLLLAVLWISKSPGNSGGWANLFDSDLVSNSTPACIVASMLFIMPSELPNIFRRKENRSDKPVEPCLTWTVAQQKVPWGLMLLLGGGFALAESVEQSRLSDFLSSKLSAFNSLELTPLIICLCLVMATVTEMTSNVAITTILLPIIAQLAVSYGVNPLYLMIPTTISASFAFMLPVATPPNAIVFSTGVLEIKHMALTGLPLNFIGIAVVTFAIRTWGTAVFDLSNVHLVADSLVNQGIQNMTENMTMTCSGAHRCPCM